MNVIKPLEAKGLDSGIAYLTNQSRIGLQWITKMPAFPTHRDSSMIVKVLFVKF